MQILFENGKIRKDEIWQDEPEDQVGGISFLKI